MKKYTSWILSLTALLWVTISSACGDDPPSTANSGSSSNQKKELGDSCSKNEDCKSNLCQGDICAESSQPHKKKELGDSCSKDLDCKSNLCQGDICAEPPVPLKANGEACKKDDECTSHKCEGTKGTTTCHAISGDSCSKELPCSADLFCKTSGTTSVCEPKIKTGDPCVDAPSCVSGICEGAPGSMVCLGKQDDPCSASLLCGSNFYCQTTGTESVCAPKLATGKPCTEASSCFSGICEDPGFGQTQCLGQQGTPCSMAVPCGSEFYCLNTGTESVCTPKKPTGQSCTDATTCLTGICEDPGSGQTQCVGTDGDPCSAALACNAASYCLTTGSESVCTPKIATAQPCTDAISCLSGICEDPGSGQIQCVGKVGDSCSSTLLCGTGLYCQTTGTESICSSKLATGQSCSVAPACISELCEGGKCVGKKGDTCTTNADCSAKFRCDTGATKTCSDKLANAETCTDGGDCISNLCEKPGSAFVCVGKEGDACANDKDCGNSFYCDDSGSTPLCTQKKQNGQFCTSASQCASQICGIKGRDGNDSGRCLGKLGDSCTTSYRDHDPTLVPQPLPSNYKPCDKSFYCTKGIPQWHFPPRCSERSKIGETCDSDRGCESNLYCDDSQTPHLCAKKLPTGSFCSRGTQCIGTCEGILRSGFNIVSLGTCRGGKWEKCDEQHPCSSLLKYSCYSYRPPNLHAGEQGGWELGKSGSCDDKPPW